MWTSSQLHSEPDDDAQRRMQAPENEVPVALPQNLLLARTDDVAVALVGLQVHTTGLSLELTVRMRPSARGRFAHTLDELVWRHGPDGGRFLLGVEFADGRRASSLPGADGVDVVFHPGGGSGGAATIEQSWWLSPLPPDGPLRFVVRCDELGIAETVTELDGTAIGRAAARVVTLWPWEPPPEYGDHEPLPPPDLPADSWFARR
ncbi:hypothetical protein [Geodermatophilus sp. DSM 44513]|uniref:hypothetical protein n=1 Tax=Geodermatophilus sp. DSM 44513 TaxID=1528104 RepID=UPI00127378C1|nr:hypothetical protein [Geodermatophilus sp. DSM 44513]WNV75837.1 hypothetical protein RTG05_00830 [Geodermatophilus sp. DSM 44513]